jgi:hypothetical protein
VGTEFRIKEYDGAESIEIKGEANWITAWNEQTLVD